MLTWAIWCAILHRNKASAIPLDGGLETLYQRGHAEYFGAQAYGRLLSRRLHRSPISGANADHWGTGDMVA